MSVSGQKPRIFVPPAAVEAAALELARVEHWDGIPKPSRQLAHADATEILEAAFAVLVEDPDLIERAARELFIPSGTPWEGIDEETREGPRERAREVLAALFGVASPSTKETER